MKTSRGFFEIGIYRPKTEQNVGTLWRSAYQLGAAGIFTIGRRYRRQASDTVQANRHIPLRHYETIEEFHEARPYNTPLICVEFGGKPLSTFRHPEQATYLLGAEDFGLPKNVLEICQHLISIETVRTESFNVSVAGSIVMYHRLCQ